jgi:anti-sigma factor RsiW
MKTDPNRAADRVSEDELHALVDGRLGAAQRQAIEKRLARDPIGAATRIAWQRQRDALRGLHQSLLEEAVPPSLLQAAQQAASARQQVDGWWRWGGVAAGVLCAFGLGWVARGLDAAPGPSPTLAAAGQAPLAARDFVRQASVAHMVYAPEVRHPVEVGAEQQDHLIKWLSKRLDRPLKLPDLRAQGYELVGGRLLPGADGARAQFMFQNAQRERVTLYLGALSRGAGATESGAAPGLDRNASAFSFSTDGPVPGFYWVEQGFGYALSGALSRAQLMELAQAVYRQL